MKQNTKDWIQYGSAIALIASAIVIACTSIWLTLDIGAGALTYVAEAVSAALAIFGITAYAVARIRETKEEILRELQEQKQNQRKNDTSS